MSEQEVDPFHLHLEVAGEAGAPASGSAESGQGVTLKDKFEGGEHLWLGMRGADAACGGDPNKLAMVRDLRRANDKEPLIYGEIVALSGDFYGSAEDLYLEKPARFPWWKGSNDLASLRKAFASELDWIQEENRAVSAGYPDNTLTFAWTAKSYLELAEDNTAHFGWHNVKKYCENHARAISYARQAKSQTAADENWMQAMFYNGFADHFLTDGFAAGHIRVPRQQIREWAPSKGYSGKLAGFLSKVLHDQDGHVDTFHAQGEQGLNAGEGLRVKNSLGTEWSTRCDGQLFLVPRHANDPLIAEPVAAVEASLREVFAAQEGRAPEGVYEALKHVPFPHPDAPSLSAKFADRSAPRIKKLLRGFAWYTQLPFIEASLDEATVASLFEALPDLMRKFRESVALDYKTFADLQKRLPAAYVEAFEAID
jgi:hypothetical protein